MYSQSRKRSLGASIWERTGWINRHSGAAGFLGAAGAGLGGDEGVAATVLVGVVAGARIRKRSPGRMVSVLKPFHLRRSSSFTPFSRAILERVSPLWTLTHVLGVAELAVGGRDKVEGGRGGLEAGAGTKTGLAGVGVEEEEGRRILSPAWIRAGFSPGLA